MTIFTISDIYNLCKINAGETKANYSIICFLNADILITQKT